MPVIPLKNDQSKDTSFQLDTSGVAAFFGGEEAISAMSSVNTFKGPWRQWLGWYNSPGSYVLARKYGQLAGFTFWDGLFPGVDVDPATLFGLAGDRGPEFVGAASGSYIGDTGQIGSLLLKECQVLKMETETEVDADADAEKKTKGPAAVWAAFWTLWHVVSGILCAVFRRVKAQEPTQKNAEETQNRSPVTVTIVDLKLKIVVDSTVDTRLPADRTCFVACFPIIFSVVGCILTGVYRDPYCLSMILLGMLSNGVACVVLGAAKFNFKHHKPAANCPRGDGVLFSQTGTDYVVIRGEEEAVNMVTRGQFVLEFPGKPEYRNIGLVSTLLIVQSLVQLLLIPQGELFGQIVFVVTLAASWASNCFLSSLDKYKHQRRVLVENILELDASNLRRYPLGSRTGMVAFLLLVLRPHNPNILLAKLLPNNTKIWKKWKRVVWERVRTRRNFTFEEPTDYSDLVDKDKTLLRTFYEDAKQACMIYNRMCADNT